MPLKEDKNICKIKRDGVACDQGTFTQICGLAAILLYEKGTVSISKCENIECMHCQHFRVSEL